MISLKQAFQLGGLSLLGFHQRTEPRKRVLLRHGQILGDKYLWLAECKFHDLSRSGARVELRCNTPLPKQIYLLDLLYLTVRDAEIAWRQDKQMGLKFNSLAVPCYQLEQIAGKPVASPLPYRSGDDSQVSHDVREVT